MNLEKPALVVIESARFEESIRFYQGILGLPLEAGKNEEGEDRWLSGDHAEVSWKDKGYFHFAIYRAKTEVVTTGLQLGFIVPDLAELHSEMCRKGIAVIHEPRKEPWGLTARYSDPDRNTISLTELRR